jgi:thymidylate kinase
MPLAPQPQHASAPDRTEVSPAVAAAVAALETSGARWVLLRGAPAEEGGDVDVLVHPDDVPAAEVALGGAGFARWPSWGRGTHRFHLAYDRASGTWAKVDLVSDLGFGPYGELATGAAPAVLERRRPGPGAPVPAPGDAFWALLLHALLDRSELPVRHLDALAAGAAEGATGGPLREALAPVLPTAEADALVRAAAARDRTALESAGARLRARWASDPAVRRRLLRARAARRLALLPVAAGRRGVTVALLGPDGAGKSTLAEALTGTPALRARSVYAGLYGAATPRPRIPVPGARLASRLARLWRLRARATAWRLRGRVVVFDRHGLDATAAPKQAGGAAAQLRRRLLATALPDPDVLLVLDAPAEVLLARKGEHDLATLDAQRDRYRALADRPGGVLVDAAVDADAVRREVTDVVWRRWTAGWRP